MRSLAGGATPRGQLRAGVPLLGVVAAVGLVLFFVGAIITHLRAHWCSFTQPAAFLLLAVGSLGLRLASS